MKKGRKLVALLLLILFASATFLGAAPSFSAGAAATGVGTLSEYEEPDYIEAKYGITDHVFQVTTVEYLDKLLAKTGTLEGTRTMNGTSLIVFADSTLATSQAAIPAINTYAKAKGIAKIFYVDMLLVGGEYDTNVNIWDSEDACDYWFKDTHSTTTQAGTAGSSLTAGVSNNVPSPAQTVTVSPGNSTVTSSFIAMGLLLKLRMANITSGTNVIYPDEYPAAFDQNPNLKSYVAATDTLLFSFTRTNNTEAGVTDTALLAPSDLTAGAITDNTAYKTAVDSVLDKQLDDTNGAVTYSDYDFTRYDFGITYTSQVVTGVASEAAETFDGLGPDNFKIRVVPYYIIRWLMEEVPGDHNIYIGGSWCGDSRAQYTIIIRNLHKYDNVPVLYNFDFRMAGNMSLTSTMIPAAYRSEDSTRWTSCVEDEGWRGAIDAGESFMLDGVMKDTGDQTIAVNNANLGSNGRNVITRVAYLGMELCHLMAGGRFEAPVLGNHYTSTNLREQYLDNGEMTITGEGTVSYVRARTTYKRFLSPHLFRYSQDAGKQTAQWSYLIQDWDILRTTVSANDPGGLLFVTQDVYSKQGGGWTLDIAEAELDEYGDPIIVRESDIGKYIDMENGGPFTNQQRAHARYTCSVFFGGEIQYSPQTPYFLVTDKGDGTPKIQDNIDVSGGGCGGDLDPAKNRPNGDNQPMIPNQGTSDYDVLGEYNASSPNKYGYDLSIGFTDTLNSTTVFNCTAIITATANKALTTISLDFRKIDISSVTIAVGGGAAAPATFTQVNDYSIDMQKLNITGVSIASGQEFVVTVVYTLHTLDYMVANHNGDINQYQGFTMHADGKGCSALGEPVASPYWFPCNNTPGDGATYRLTLSAPTSYTKIGPGVLVGGITGSDTAASVVWEVKQPVAAYQVFATFSSNVTKISAIGGTSITTNVPLYKTADGREIPYYCYVNTDLYKANTAADRTRDKADMFFGKLPYYISTMEKLFGAYPGESLGFVFERLGDGEGNAIDTAIETKDRPFFSYASIVTEETFVHEFAHQWFGDSVRMDTWDELWLNEGFATYATDLFYQYTTGWNPFDKWETVYNALPASHLFWTGGAPANILDEVALFDGPRFAYYGGAMALSLLHDGLGDDTFFNILNTWTSKTEGFGGKSATTEDFIALAEEISGVDLTAWSNAWLYGMAKPAAFTAGIASTVVSAPEKMTLISGYTATSSDEFFFSGSPAPTVTKISGDDKITWNSETNRLDIAPGLAPGIYDVELKADNGFGDYEIVTFRLIVGSEMDLIENLQSQIDDALRTINEMLEAGDLEGIEAELTRLAGLITDLQNAGFQTSAQVNTAIETVTNALASRILALENSINNSGDLESIQAELTRLAGLITNLQDAGFQTSAQVNTAIEAVTNALASRILALENSIVNGDLESIQAELTRLEGLITALEDSGLATDLDTLKTDITNAYKAITDALEARVKMLEDRVTELEGELNKESDQLIPILALIISLVSLCAFGYIIVSTVLGKKKKA